MSGLPDLAWDNRKDEIVRLLQQGADVNEQDYNGYTALQFACEYHHTEITEILLKNKKINVNLQNVIGDSPFSSACANNSYECACLMLQDPRVDINLADDEGWSPLMEACCRGNTKIVQLLISFGRNIDILKKSTEDYGGIQSGSTALDVAKQLNNTDIVQLLEQYLKNPKETQKTLRNELNLKGKKNKIKNNMKKVKTVMK